MYDWVKDNPKFKAFCRRRINGSTPTTQERHKAARKAREAEFRAFCKPKGMWSILESGNYTTGRLMVRSATADDPNTYTRTETAKLIKNGDRWTWTSEIEQDWSDGWTEVPQFAAPGERNQAKLSVARPTKGNGPVSWRRVIMADFVRLYRADGMEPGLGELKRAVRDFEKGAEGQIFEHVDEQGKHRFWDVDGLYAFAVAHGERLVSPIGELGPHLAQYGGVEESRLLELTSRDLEQPALGILMPAGTTVIVDGNHRIVRLWRDGIETVRLYRVTLEQSEPFRIHGLPDWLLVSKENDQ